MPEETAPGGAFTWSVEGRPIRISVTAEVLASIGRAAREGLEKVPRRGLEVGGVLLGTRRGDELSITGWQPIACEHAKGPGFELSANDEEALRRQLKALAVDPQLAGQQVLGWFHSHTRDDICLTKADLDLYNRFFPAPWQVALVVKPHLREPARAGFFFREPSGSIRADSSWQEFMLEAGRRPQQLGFDPAATGGDPAPPAVRPKGAGAPSAAAAPAPAAPVRRLQAGWRRLALIATSALAITAALFLATARRQAPPEPGALALALEAQGERLALEWDRAAVREATGATLTIADGGGEVVVELTPEEVRTGRVTYYRRSGEVGFRLEVARPGGLPLEATAEYAGSPPQAKPAAAEEDPAEVQRLESEIAALRTRLEAGSAQLRQLREEVRQLERRIGGAGRRRR